MDPKSFERSGVQSLRKGIGSPSGKAPRGRKEEPMHEWQSLSHVRWECKYHVVIIPKYRRKVFYGRLRRQIGTILRELCRQRELRFWKGMRCPTTFTCV